MKAAVVYDTKWGNTEKIAQAVAAGIGKGTKAFLVSEMDPEQSRKVTLLILGSPVIGGRPTKPMQEFLKKIVPSPGSALSVATFDTRMTMKFAQKFGFAAVRMADQLKEQGNTVVCEPEGFIVKGQKGPLEEGELDRATQWGKELSRKFG